MATEQPISITYTVDNSTKTETFDFLIVACDPRWLRDALQDRTEFEDHVIDSLKSFTFRTSLFKAKRPDRPQAPIDDPDGARTNTPNYAVRFNPGVVEHQDGRPYGFRDEVFAHDEDLKPSPTNETWCTLYQLDGRPLIGNDDDQRKRLEAKLDTKRDNAIASDAPDDLWIDWKPKDPTADPEESILVDYFPHFSREDLDAGLPWQVIDHQGDKNTFYVSSFTCFESVLHCYLYEEELMNPNGKVMKKGVFPTDDYSKENARFAVIGAGPSGLLFASQHLKQKGYKNFVILEKAGRYGGKTFTFQKPIPADPSKTVPCELGTCYLSPAYEPMRGLFEKYEAGEVVALDQGSKLFRSIVDSKVARNQQEREDGVEYGAWTLRKNGSNMTVEGIKMLVATVKYIVLHYAVMGTGINDPLPENSPDESSVVESIRRLFSAAKDIEASSATRSLPGSAGSAQHGEDEVGVDALYKVVSAEKRDHDSSAMPARGLFSPMDDIGQLVDEAVAKIADMVDFSDFFTLSDLKRSSSDMFYTDFSTYLDDHGMSELKTVFAYDGALTKVPAYYGMVWLTPPTFLFSIKSKLSASLGSDEEKKRGTMNNVTKGLGTLWKKIVDLLFSIKSKLSARSGSDEEKKRGTVNIVTKGWGTLWDKIVETDLADDRIVLNANITAITRSSVR